MTVHIVTSCITRSTSGAIRSHGRRLLKFLDIFICIYSKFC